MVDAIVSPLLKQLKSVAAEEIKAQVKLVVGVDQEVKMLTSNFQAIQAVLSDAEQRQVKEESVRLWLDQLKDASYYMEDVLEEWITARLKLRMEGVEVENARIQGAGSENVQIEGVEAENSLLSLLKVCLSFPAASCFGFKEVVLRRDIALKIKQINQKLDGIVKQKEMFNFNVNEVKSIEKLKRVQSTYLIDESEICGRNDEKNALISKLCGDGAEKGGLHIISVVGMGGIGKTYLAQLAYNNDKVKISFEKTIWVCVSDPFDQLSIARAIIEELEGSAPNLNEFNSLLKHIQELITGKKFLLVLDDVWNEDFNTWEPFYYCLKNGFPGSKILITTRNETVARVMGATDTILLEQLVEEQCWLLFKRFAFSGRPPSECEQLENIGRKIVGKCKGLPLAAKTIGSLLLFKRTRQEWESVLDSETWKLEEFKKGLVVPLLLSYNNLPSTVKRCFSYCAVFPKGYSIEKDKLIRLWMAQGYLSVKEKEEMEQIGQEYFDILVRHSFFQNFEKDDDNNIISCKMHDIVHDFAQFLSKNECFMIETKGRDETYINSSLHNTVCHSRLMLRGGASFPVSICEVKRLRSLFIYCQDVDCSSVGEVLPKLFVELKCLRVLDVNGRILNLVKEIPEEIEKLIHLAYLNLSGQEVEKLPETLCELYNLRTLDISGCGCLKELPQGIGKLINLRHLLNGGCTSLSYMPAGIKRLIHLRTLKVFVVGGGVHESKACKLEALKNLNLFGDCTITGLGNVSEFMAEAPQRLQLENMKNLDALELDFTRHVEEGRKNQDDELLLETFQSPPHLKKLAIIGYRGSTFSFNWIMSLTNLRHLNLTDSRNCKHLPPLGKLPSLEMLHIKSMDSVKKLGNEFLGIEGHGGSSSSSSSSTILFPNLRGLFIMDMDVLEEWDDDGEKDMRIMPRLSWLGIYGCSKLKALPNYILQGPALQTLLIERSGISKQSGIEDWPNRSDIPLIFRKLIRSRIQEKLRIALYVQKSGLQFMHAARGLPNLEG